MKSLKYGMKMVASVLEKRLCRIVGVNEIKLGFIFEKETNDVVFIQRMLEENFPAKGKVVYLLCVSREGC